MYSDQSVGCFPKTRLAWSESNGRLGPSVSVMAMVEAKGRMFGTLVCNRGGLEFGGHVLVVTSSLSKQQAVLIEFSEGIFASLSYKPWDLSLRGLYLPHDHVKLPSNRKSYHVLQDRRRRCHRKDRPAFSQTRPRRCHS